MSLGFLNNPWCVPPPPTGTFFTVRLPVLHVKHAVSDGLLTGDADEAGHVPGLLQSVHHMLHASPKNKELVRLTEYAIPIKMELHIPGPVALRLGHSPPESCAGSQHRRGRSTARSNAGSTTGLSPPQTRFPPGRSCSGHR